MDKNVKRQVRRRLVITLLLMAALALIPPLVYKNPLYNVFYLDDAAKEIGSRFTDSMQWIHRGGIFAIWVLNMIFFSINRKHNDSGDRLQARTLLQNVLNILMVILFVGVMISYRYALSAEAWIGVILPTSTPSVAKLLMPYYIFAICGLFLWGFCMNAAPAPNCAVRWPIAKAIDKKNKQSGRSR